jgi:hypothetical protein
VSLVGSWISVAGSPSSHAGGEGGRWQLGPVIAGGGRGRWPVFAGYQCGALEPSSLDVALEILAQVRYQVGFASLEPNLGAGGEWSCRGCRWRPALGGPSRAALFQALVLLRELDWGSRVSALA